MASSGTTNFDLPIDEIIDRAYARVFGEQVDGYDLKSANTNLGLLFQEFEVRGSGLWTMVTAALKNPMLIADGGTYVLDPSITMLRDVWTRDITLTPPGDDLIVASIPATTYNLIPNKLDAGRSYQYYLDQQLGGYVLRLYPVVNIDNNYALYGRYVRRTYDIGVYSNTVDAPVRWTPAIIAGLAWYTARDNRIKIAKLLGSSAGYAGGFAAAKTLIDDLHTDFEAAYQAAANDDTDASPTRIEVDASAYFGR